jgi:hypothetical protein
MIYSYIQNNMPLIIPNQISTIPHTLSVSRFTILNSKEDMAHVQQLTFNFHIYLALTTRFLTQAIEWSNDREQEPFLVPRLALVKVLAIGVPFEDEVMKLLEIEPWLDPDLGLTYLLLPWLISKKNLSLHLGSKPVTRLRIE